MFARSKSVRAAFTVAFALAVVYLIPTSAQANNGCNTDGLPETSSDYVKMRSLSQLCTQTWIYVSYYAPERPTTPTWAYEDVPTRIKKGATRAWDVPGEIISAKFSSVYVDPSLPVNPANPGWSSSRTGSSWWRHN